MFDRMHAFGHVYVTLYLFDRYFLSRLEELIT